MIRIRTLGTAELQDDEGSEIRSVLTGSKRLALFTYLVLARPRGFHRRDKLLAVFWPELDSERARPALSQAVHLLRRSFGHDVIDSRGDELGISAGAVWCDALAFESALEAGDAAGALELYGGELLPGLFVTEAPEFERWLDGERSRLAGLAATAVRELIERAAAAGDFAAAEAWSRRALDLSSYDEPALVGLMRTLHRAGDRAAAIRAYEDFARRMREDLDLEPSPETQVVLEEVRSAPPPRPALVPAADGAALRFAGGRSAGGAAGPAVVDAGAGGAAAPDAVGADTGAPGPPPAARDGGQAARVRRRLVGLAAVVALVVAAVALTLLRRPAADAQEDTPPLTRVAVLYFTDSTPQRDLGYLSEGLTATLIDQLTHVRGLSVVSQNGVRPFRGNSLSADSIARRLRVGLLVDGTLVRSGDKLRVTVELVDARTGTALGSQTLERPSGELFSLLDDVSAQVATFLRRRLGNEVQITKWRAGTSSLEAWRRLQRAAELYAGIADWERAGNFAQAHLQLAQADSLAQAAGRLDPAWPQPAVLRAEIGRQRAFLAAITSPTDRVAVSAALDEAMAYAEQGVARGPADATALQTRGTIRYWRWLLVPPPGRSADPLLAVAESDLSRSIEIDPSRPEAQMTLSAVLFSRGSFRESRMAAQRAYDADAFLTSDDETLNRLFVTSFELGEDDQASRWCEESRLRQSESWLYAYCSLMLLGWSESGDHDPRKALLQYEAYAGGQEGSADSPQLRERVQPMLATLTATVLARAGRRDSAEAMLRRARAASHDPELLPLEAGARVWLGQPDSALALLREYLRVNPTSRPRLSSGRMFQQLHGRPGWIGVMQAPISRR